MQIAIASGKGGTGKTTISVALAAFLSMKNYDVHLLDCDVEEPNSNLFLKADIEEEEKIYAHVPVVDEDKCSGCGKCGEICQFSAIVLINNSPLVFPDMCHSCGGCKLVCDDGAINEVQKEIGTVESGQKGKIKFSGGRLKISEVLSPLLIADVKKRILKDEITIIDSPPGTSCPVIESIDQVNYVVLVTEPTPFGLHDLKLAVEMVREMDLGFGVVINKSDIGDSGVVDYCNKENIDVIVSIPESRVVAEKYSRGELVEFFVHEFSNELEKILTVSGIDLTEGIVK